MVHEGHCVPDRRFAEWGVDLQAAARKKRAQHVRASNGCCGATVAVAAEGLMPNLGFLMPQRPLLSLAMSLLYNSFKTPDSGSVSPVHEVCTQCTPHHARTD